jgi:hypothetical protein
MISQKNNYFKGKTVNIKISYFSNSRGLQVWFESVFLNYNKKSLLARNSQNFQSGRKENHYFN